MFEWAHRNISWASEQQAPQATRPLQDACAFSHL
jgi:hypothetical protein